MMSAFYPSQLFYLSEISRPGDTRNGNGEMGWGLTAQFYDFNQKWEVSIIFIKNFKQTERRRHTGSRNGTAGLVWSGWYHRIRYDRTAMGAGAKAAFVSMWSLGDRLG